MHHLLSFSIEALLDPEHAESKQWLAGSAALLVSVGAVAVLGTLFAWVVARMWRKPRNRALARADFGITEIDLALLVPLGVVFMFAGSIASQAVQLQFEPQPVLDVYAAVRGGELGHSDLASSLAEVRRNLGPADARMSATAGHAGKLAGATVLIAFVPLLLVLLRRRHSRLSSQSAAAEADLARKSLFPPKDAGWLKLVPVSMAWVPLALGLMWLSVAFLAWLDPGVLEPDHKFETQGVLAKLMAESSLQWPAAILSAVIAAPLFEEFLFRGVMQGTLRRWLPFPLACLIPVALFTVVHEIWASPQILFPVAGLGIALGWVYERTGNVWYAVGLHAFHNGATLAVASMGPGG